MILDCREAGGTARCLAGVAATAHAEPVTYAGKLGNIDIVVEFTGDPATRRRGTGGPLLLPLQGRGYPFAGEVEQRHRLPAGRGRSLRCQEVRRRPGPPIAAIWRLSSADKGKTLEGTWTAKKALPLKLTRIASRAQTETPATTPRDLYDFTDMTFSADDAPITMEASPYDYLKLDFAPKADAKAGWPDAAYDYVTDPRTKFARPRIVDLAGGAPIEAANALLQTGIGMTASAP